MSDELHFEYGDKTVLELQNLQERGHLNLEPGFQRDSVWTASDRRKLMQSVFEGYPIPSIFLYRRDENGLPVYDVVDGKQRLETLFMFTRTWGFSRLGFEVRHQFPDDDGHYWYDWRALGDWGLSSRVLTYKIQTVEVGGPLSSIIDLFVRINSTGKALTGSEKRHARYYKSPFLKEAQRLAKRKRRFFVRHRIASASQISRMKDVELVCELLASIANGGPIDRKAAVDKAVGSEAFHAATLKKISGDLGATLTVLGRMFPDLKTTRFRNMAEFYSLFMVIWELRQANLLLTDRRRNRIASELLKALSNGVDRVRDRQRQAQGAGREHRLYASYLITVQQSTDKLQQRRQRAEILRSILAGLFEKRDEKRLFSPEQRRLLWNSDDQRKCRVCGKRLTWTTFQVDHIKAHSLGGKTALKNAALLCRPCNSRKGARRAA